MHQNQERKVLSNIKLVNIPTVFFVVDFGGTCVWLTNWKEGEDNFNGETVRAKVMKSPPLTVGARDAEANKISGEERLPVESEGAWERRGRSEVPDRRKGSSETGHFRAG